MSTALIYSYKTDRHSGELFEAGPSFFIRAVVADITALSMYKYVLQDVSTKYERAVSRSNILGYLILIAHL